MFGKSPVGFKGGLSAGNNSTIACASPATTTRDWADLAEREHSFGRASESTQGMRRIWPVISKNTTVRKMPSPLIICPMSTPSFNSQLP